MKYKGSYQGDKKNTVKVIGRLVPISFKTSTQVAKFIRNKKLDYAIDLLQKVQETKVAVPYVKYLRDTPHRKGNLAAGRYPFKVSREIQKLLLSLKANAIDQGMKSENIILIHIAVQTGPKLWHYGRHRGRVRKVCNIEIIGHEDKTKKTETTSSKELAPKRKALREEETKPKVEIKPKVEEPKPEPKKEESKPKTEKKEEIKVEKKEEKKEPKNEDVKKEETKKENKVSQTGQEPKTKPKEEATPEDTKAKQEETK